jgi:hypothetical protein
MAQPMLATAVDLVRDVLRHPPVEIPDDPIAELEAQHANAIRVALLVEARIHDLDEADRLSLLLLTARLAAGLVPLMPEGRGETFLSMMADEAMAD